MAETPELAQTAVNTAAPASGPLSATTLRPGDSRRPTVLPRVEWVGEKPSLSLTGRERFEELKPLGAGGMGEVVLAKDHDIERSVALKRIPAQSDVGLVLRFVEEIRIVGQLEHPNIVPVHDVGIDAQGRYYFVMKHLRGETLEAIVARLRRGDPATHERFPFTVRLQAFLGVLNAVGYAHEQGYIHRDLKPANIMVGPFGEVTVMDWGLAKRVRGPEAPRADAPGAIPQPASATASNVREVLKTQAGEVMGTPFYMSPEQACGEDLDERSDIYSLSVILHELLFLDHYLESQPTVAATLEGVQNVTPEVFAQPPRPPQPVVPAEWGWFILKGMEKEPGERFQSIAEMTAALQSVFSAHVKVQCFQTLLKRALQNAERVVDAHPLALVLGTVGMTGLLLAGLVKSVVVLLH